MDGFPLSVLGGIGIDARPECPDGTAFYRLNPSLALIEPPRALQSCVRLGSIQFSRGLARRRVWRYGMAVLQDEDNPI